VLRSVCFSVRQTKQIIHNRKKGENKAHKKQREKKVAAKNQHKKSEYRTYKYIQRSTKDRRGKQFPPVEIFLLEGGGS